jgi:hypothetical protein
MKPEGLILGSHRMPAIFGPSSEAKQEAPFPVLLPRSPGGNARAVDCASQVSREPALLSV